MSSSCLYNGPYKRVERVEHAPRARVFNPFRTSPLVHVRSHGKLLLCYRSLERVPDTRPVKKLSQKQRNNRHWAKQLTLTFPYPGSHIRSRKHKQQNCGYRYNPYHCLIYLQRSPLSRSLSLPGAGTWFNSHGHDGRGHRERERNLTLEVML